jgi:hypothetical protein
MYSTELCIGECPYCGDELYVFKTRNRKKLARCISDECPKKYIFPVPSKGSLEVTGLICEKKNLPILAIIPNMKIKAGVYKPQNKNTYFWTDTACFACPKQHQCPQLKELEDEYD